ncbi:hypothetical protein GYMLUDRAFT_375433 [Collybiopsis luxurians FD-317 M1]|uniref:RSE1/DDB1/CPSF1 second beta-propeller domain-containing protein n=1 Tax=Collybiopsis luxurians FD-317 M1 TaxID=944289 RepID=A0A0D0BC94_9AGAR|nr:hypothetical protein GYMLUDRAFT_375433 [Collybiopsis luxurians FD-317 M1]
MLSFVNDTFVLSVGEANKQVQDTGFPSSARTLAVQQIGADACLQVNPEGIRSVLRYEDGHVPSSQLVVLSGVAV